MADRMLFKHALFVMLEEFIMNLKFLCESINKKVVFVFDSIDRLDSVLGFTTELSLFLKRLYRAHLYYKRKDEEFVHSIVLISSKEIKPLYKTIRFRECGSFNWDYDNLTYNTLKCFNTDDIKTILTKAVYDYGLRVDGVNLKEIRNSLRFSKISQSGEDFEINPDDIIVDINDDIKISRYINWLSEHIWSITNGIPLLVNLFLDYFFSKNNTHNTTGIIHNATAIINQGFNSIYLNLLFTLVHDYIIRRDVEKFIKGELDSLCWYKKCLMDYGVCNSDKCELSCKSNSVLLWYLKDIIKLLNDKEVKQFAFISLSETYNLYKLSNKTKFAFDNILDLFVKKFRVLNSENKLNAVFIAKLVLIFVHMCNYDVYDIKVYFDTNRITILFKASGCNTSFCIKVIDDVNVENYKTKLDRYTHAFDKSCLKRYVLLFNCVEYFDMRENNNYDRPVREYNLEYKDDTAEEK